MAELCALASSCCLAESWRESGASVASRMDRYRMPPSSKLMGLCVELGRINLIAKIKKLELDA
jgi:hypothetical protein